MKSAFVLAGLCLGPSSLSAFEIATHATITNQAYLRSRLGTDLTLSRQLGIDTHLYQGIQTLAPFSDNYFDFSGVAIGRRNRNPYEEDVLRSIGLRSDSLLLNGWLMRGAIREDDNPGESPTNDADTGGAFHREFNHFFDPQKNRPLTRFGIGAFYALSAHGVTTLRRAPDWAMGTDDIFASPNTLGTDTLNNFTVLDAREAMFRAVTMRFQLPDGTLQELYQQGVSTVQKESNRKAWWATTFRALGDVLHLNQDMAQPQHTRNEAHSGLGGRFSSSFTGHTSTFEKYLDSRARQANFEIDGQPPIRYAILDFGNHPIPNFSSYRDYWSTAVGVEGAATGKGLADYSSRGFLTNANNIGSSEYTAPSTSALAYAKVPTSYPSPSSLLKINLLQATVPDGIVGASPPIKMATESMWSGLLGPTINTLSRLNYDDHATLLIPRAVAYSAGLIDYFFRGQLEIRLPTEGVYGILDHSAAGSNCKDTCGFSKIKLKLANATPDISPSGGGAVAPQIMPGGTLVVVAKYHRNTCYTTDLEGEYDSRKLINGATETKTDYMTRCRTSEEEITVSQPKANQTVPACNGACNANAMGVTFNFDTPIPINATDLYLQVVYRGVLGTEQDAVVVGTKDIAEPTYLSVVNVTDYAVCYNNNLYYKSASGGLRYTSPASTPPQVPAMVEGVPAEAYCNPTSYGYWRLTFTAAPSLQIPAPGINEDLAIARADALQPQEFARVAVLIDDGRIYKEDIALHLDQADKPPLSSALHQIDYAADGSPTARLLDYKDARFRKVKSNVPTFGIRYNVQGTGSCMQPTSISAEPTDPAYAKPTVMKTVTIKFN